MTSRLEYVLEYTEKKRVKEIHDLLDHDLEDELSLFEVSIIEESLSDSKMIADLCLTSSCENCEKFCSKECIKNILHSNGDTWVDGLNNIDDALEENFRGEYEERE